MSSLQRSIQLSSASPIKKSIQSSSTYNSGTSNASQTRKNMAEEMSGLWVGPMPILEFLDEFVPMKLGFNAPPRLPTLLNTMPTKVPERVLCTKFIELVNDHGLIPGFKLVDTSNHPDKASANDKKIRPDVSMYCADTCTSANVTQFGELELHFEFKPNDQYDPFDDPPSNITPDERLAWSFETTRDLGADCRGQLTNYVTEWCSRQHRKWAFSVYIGDPYIRFIYWDRSGAVVTEKLNFRNNSQTLVEFLWRFSHMSSVERGRDETVRVATEEEIRLAEEHLSEWKNPKERPVIVLKVCDGDKEREFIAWGSMANADSLTGRSTRAYPVFEKATQKILFLKDTWRAVSLEKESDILQELNKAGVRNVPIFECGGDISSHITRSHTYTAEDVPEPSTINPKGGPPAKYKRWKCGKNGLTERIHHRFTEDFIGIHLDKFKTSKQMMTVIHDAFIAHRDAFTLCNILHRDVSGKNILIGRDDRGVLNDWDLAKRTDAPGPRQHERTGTWQFISTLNLLNSRKSHEVQDDLESFVLVVLYHALRYTLHNKTSVLPVIMKYVFDDYIVWPNNTITGGQGKKAMFTSREFIGMDLEFTNSKGMTTWLNFAIKAVKEWHQSQDITFEPDLTILGPIYRASTAPSATSDNTPLLLQSHQALHDVWTTLLGLSVWPTDDSSIDQLPKPSKSQARSKRTHEQTTSGCGEDSDLRQKAKKAKSVRRSSSSHGPCQSRSTVTIDGTCV